MNKVLIICFIAGAFSVTACGQKLKESQVSAAAKTAFKNQYPNTAAKWEKEDGNYEVNFKQNGKSSSAVIKTDGTIIETETDISINELPQGAQSYIKDHFKAAKIKEASKIVRANGDVIFEALVNGKDLMFDSNGKFIEAVKE